MYFPAPSFPVRIITECRPFHFKPVVQRPITMIQMKSPGKSFRPFIFHFPTDSRSPITSYGIFAKSCRGAYFPLRLHPVPPFQSCLELVYTIYPLQSLCPVFNVDRRVSLGSLIGLLEVHLCTISQSTYHIQNRLWYINCHQGSNLPLSV